MSPDHLLESDISSLAEVSAAAQAAEAFCRSHGADERLSRHVALCVEEMAASTIQHGFSHDGRSHHLSVRVQCKEDRWVLRFRDDCASFDPVHYVPEDENETLGIRLVMAMADEVRYTYSLNLNNLTVLIRHAADAETA